MQSRYLEVQQLRKNLYCILKVPIYSDVYPVFIVVLSMCTKQSVTFSAFLITSQVELTCKICKICARILHKSCMQNMQDLQIALQGRARFLQKSCSVHGKCLFSCTYLANSCRNLAIHFCKILQAIFRHARNLALLISCKKTCKICARF